MILDMRFVIGQNCPEELEWEFEEESSHYLLIENGVSKALDTEKQKMGIN